MHVHVPPIIWQDVLLAAEWYEAQSPGLAADLVDEIDLALASIAENPYMHSIMEPSIRMARVKRFPYGIFFSIERDAAVVFAITDLRRSPSHWRKRRPRKK